MNTTRWLVIFALDHQRYALYLSAVERVIQAIEITSLPGSPGIVAGVINVQGQIIPVFDVRMRFNLAERDLNCNDQYIIARTTGWTVAMIVDKVNGIADYSTDTLVKAETILPGIEYVEGVMQLEDGLVLIHDLDKFLSLEERYSLERAMKRPGGDNAVPAP